MHSSPNRPNPRKIVNLVHTFGCIQCYRMLRAMSKLGCKFDILWDLMFVIMSLVGEMKAILQLGHDGNANEHACLVLL